MNQRHTGNTAAVPRAVQPMFEAIDAMLSQLEFTHPVEMDDINAVKGALEPALPAGVRLEIFHRIREVHLQFRRAGALVTERKLPVKGAPCPIEETTT